MSSIKMPFRLSESQTAAPFGETLLLLHQASHRERKKPALLHGQSSDRQTDRQRGGEEGPVLAGQRPEEHPAFREGRKIKPRCAQQVTGTQNPSTAMGAAEKLGEARL